MLGRVVAALSFGKKPITYRDSKLTMLLQDFLKGTCYIVMLACVSPADNSRVATLKTLTFANRAKMVHFDQKAAEIAQLKPETVNFDGPNPSKLRAVNFDGPV
ncbi:hypothetical protein HAZT_HAZT006559 [Hyalella azteca]|uniref:Kinesin motor domain-containing protein n=1 Tax=Hyalella azteca TaxID=294128 RepID=A0A6A0GTX9_HYAAZ|nr:hypothetical protein HAZT_HAZT006559 [Hyalella azteca]